MFKVGDIVKIKDDYNDKYWYNPNYFIIKEIFYNSEDEMFIILNCQFYVGQDTIREDGIYLATKKMRKQKLENLKFI